jgi:ribosome-binding factor A
MRRVGDALRQCIAGYFLEETFDAKLHNISITDVAISKDLKNAKVYFSTLSTEDVETVKDELNSHIGAIKKRIAREMRLRYIPVLAFFYDNALAYGLHINDLLKKIETND